MTISDFAHLTKNIYWKFRNAFTKLKIIGSDKKNGSKFGLGSVRRIVNQVQYKMRYIDNSDQIQSERSKLKVDGLRK